MISAVFAAHAELVPCRPLCAAARHATCKEVLPKVTPTRRNISMKNWLVALIGGVGSMALQGCMSDAQDAQESVSSDSAAINSTIQITSDWGSGYCANVNVANNLSVSANTWAVLLDMKGGKMQGTASAPNLWNAKTSGLTGMLTLTPQNYNAYIVPGGTTSFGFCADGTSKAVIAAYNMGSTAYAACDDNSGLNSTRAALAVAAANELGRWKPEVDFVIGSDGKVALSSTGLGRCTNSCKNVKGLLGQQDSAVSNYVPQTVFNPTVYMEDLKASFGRQKSKMDDLSRNNPGALPPAHKLTLVGGPTNMGGGSCGPHYVYRVTTESGAALSSSQAANLANALCFFGQGSCGANPYIGFIGTSQGCPSGQTCVAIDPIDGDNSSGSTTTAGSAPTYPLNRVWNPDNSLLGTACITTTNKLGTLQSKCSVTPSTCGYLYCIAN
jgi:hypothetical protein